MYRFISFVKFCLIISNNLFSLIRVIILLMLLLMNYTFFLKCLIVLIIWPKDFIKNMFC